LGYFIKEISMLKFLAAFLFASSTALGSYVVPPGSINTAKLATGAVTQIKMGARQTGNSVGAGGVAISPSTAGFSTASSTYVDVTNATVSIVSTGRPIMLMLQPIAGVGGGVTMLNTGTVTGFLKILVGGSTLVTQWQIPIGSTPPGAFSYIDIEPAGTYVYKVQVQNGGGGGTIFLNSMNLMAYEL
jgi:hypothetical protein